MEGIHEPFGDRLSGDRSIGVSYSVISTRSVKPFIQLAGMVPLYRSRCLLDSRGTVLGSAGKELT